LTALGISYLEQGRYADATRAATYSTSPEWVASLMPLSVDGMIVAASAALLAESRAGRRGRALLVAGSIASLAANAAVAEAPLTRRIIATWLLFALTASWERLQKNRRRRHRRGRGEARPPDGVTLRSKPSARVRALIVRSDKLSSFLDASQRAARAYRRVVTRKFNDTDTMLRHRLGTTGAQRLAALLLDLAERQM